MHDDAQKKTKEQANLKRGFFWAVTEGTQLIAAFIPLVILCFCA
jgi:hypothetical protein